MKIEIKEYNSLSLLVSSIVLFVLGGLMFSNPQEVVKVITYILGGLIFILGVYNCIKNYLDVKKDSTTSSFGMVIGVLLLVIGLVIIFLSGAIEFLFRFVIGGWILFSGINRLAYALMQPKKDSYFWGILVLAILLISGGVYTVLYKNLAVKYFGLILMIYSTLEIIGFIFSRKKGVKEKETDTDINEEKVIDATVIEEVKTIEHQEEPNQDKNKNKNKKNKKKKKDNNKE